MNVANKGIIRRLTMRFLKSAWVRNIIAIIAIALTSVMFTTVFTIGGNMIATIQDQTMRQVGGNAHGGLKYLTMEQYEHFSHSKIFKEIAYRKCLASVTNDALLKMNTEISYAEDRLAEGMFSRPTLGRMPIKANEMATSTLVLDALGIPHQIGAEVFVEYSFMNGQQHSDVFTLTGFWEGDPVLMAQQIWVSEEYVDSIVSAYEPKNDLIAGAVMADLWFSNTFDVGSKIERLIKERGFDLGEISFGVNWAYMSSGEIDPTLVMIAILVLTLILLSGYLIIYSVFAISVKADIHFYGLLKTIGTTGKQLRRIVRGQAFALSAFGIPVGLLLGYLSGGFLTPMILGITNFTLTQAGNSFNPLIFVFAAAFSLLTVFIGCRKPGKIAARVSPVEAVKYSGITSTGRRKAKKTRKVTALSMAWGNVTREKKNLCMIVLSLSLALILLNAAVSASRSFDMDAYMSDFAVSDFAVADASLYNISVMHTEFEGIRQDFIDELTELEIWDIGCVYFSQDPNHELTPRALENFIAQFEADREYLDSYYREYIPLYDECVKNGWLPTGVLGVGKLPLSGFYSGYDRLVSGDFALTNAFNGNPIYDVGDTVTLVNGAGENREFEIIGLFEDFPYSLSPRFSFIPGQEIILADNVFIDFFEPHGAMQVNFDVPDERLAEIESWIADYTTMLNPALAYISRETLKAEFENLQTTYLALGSAMAFILALVGVLNFINTSVASIIARRRELAMLQSVGMTGKQLRRTLLSEGAIYTALTVFLTLTAGLGVSLLIVHAIAGQTWFFKPYFTIIPSLYCVAPLLLICAIVPLVCYKKLTRESLVERLRVE